MRLIDADALKNDLITFFPDRCLEGITTKTLFKQILTDIDNAPTFEMPNWYKVYEDVKGTFEKYQSTQIAWEQGYEAGLEQGKQERPKGEWVVTAEDNDGVHRICCPFCSYEKGSNNTDPIIVTFTNFPKFCENCGADMRKDGAEE